MGGGNNSEHRGRRDYRRPNRCQPHCERMDVRVLLSMFAGSGHGGVATTSIIKDQPVASHVSPSIANFFASALAGTTWGASAQSVTTPAPTITYPVAPSFTATAIAPTQINLTWSGVAGATGYYVADLINSNWTLIDTDGSGSTSYTVNDLSPDTTYDFDVGASNAAGTTWGANYQSVTTPVLERCPFPGPGRS
jgi:Fibronectin type III domain